MSDDDQEEEFDVVASWTVDSVGRLGADLAVPAACRGSGGPGAMAWLADWLVAGAGTRFLDVGAGLGGSAAWLAGERAVRPVLAEPMVGAVQGSRRLFALPAVVAAGERLPFASARFDSAWALGVLSTTEAKAELLAELRRVLVPAGRIGLVAYVATVDPVPGEPEGNAFPTWPELETLVADAGLRMLTSVQWPTSPVPATSGRSARIGSTPISSVITPASVDGARRRLTRTAWPTRWPTGW